MKKTIYKKAVALLAKEEIDNHESDLYLKKTEISFKLIKEYKFKSSVREFYSNIDHQLWYDIPFAYDPFWEKIERHL